MPDNKDRDRSATRIQDDYVAGLFPHRDEYRPPEYVVYMERAAAALKTVRIVAYSGMVAFVILAAYGFFLIYQLTSDAHRMTVHMGTMSNTMTGMRGSMVNMESSMSEMQQHMANMDASVQHMAGTVSLIQHSTRNLDRNISPMMGSMSSLPFMGGGNRGYQGAPPYSPPPPLPVVPYSPRSTQVPGGVTPPAYYAQPWRAPQVQGQQPQVQQPQARQPQARQPQARQPQARQPQARQPQAPQPAQQH